MEAPLQAPPVGPQPRSAAGSGDGRRTVRGAVASLAVLSLSQSLRMPEELTESGATPAQLVREHQLEVFASSFPGWVAGFALIYCIVAPTAFGLFVWLAVSFGLELNEPCDVPLKAWAIVVFASNAWDIVHVFLLRYICHHDISGQSSLPWHIRIYLALTTLLDFGWLFVGLHWVRIAETCTQTAPKLFMSAKVYAAASLAFGLIIGINALGLYTIMNWMLRRGMLSSRSGAPPGTLEQLPVLKFDASASEFQDSSECCICLAAFTGSQEIRKTPQCDHVFHSRCLGNWLRVNKTCPLCRRDLSSGIELQPEPGILRQIVGRPFGP